MKIPLQVFVVLAMLAGSAAGQTNLDGEAGAPPEGSTPEGAMMPPSGEEPVPAVEVTEAASREDPAKPQADSLGPETHIYSDTVELALESRTATYRGNVRVEDPRLHLTCEQLTAVLPEDGKRVEQIVAETNVVILVFDEQGKTNWATAERAVYTIQISATATNEVVELTGDPRVERADVILTGDVIVWDRIRDSIFAENEHMIYKAPLEAKAPDPSDSAPTNTAVRTNTVAEPPPAAVDSP